MSEPLRLIGEINQEFGIELINCSSNSAKAALYPELSAEDPLFSPPSHPFKTGARMHLLASKVKSNFPSVKVAASSFSQYRQYGVQVGAALVERGEADIIGFGRQALAYPDFANDILSKGELDKSKVCLCCDGCFRLNHEDKNAGCIVRDECYNRFL
jgi:2,4-dienoyl-CoA reductase-like NADH-dependent reductase (Old Yellow Enzyme family)